MPPEKRLTIREAVELIAKHGTPISESALRARVRNGQIGVAREGRRITTNPLNLVAAGLLPVEVLDAPMGPSIEVSDQELHEWLNPSDNGAGGSVGAPGLWDPNEVEDGASVSDTPGQSEADEAPGPLERALGPVTERSELPGVSASQDQLAGTSATDRAGRQTEGALHRRRPERRTVLLVGACLAVAAIVTVAPSAAKRDAVGPIAELRPVSLAGAANAGPTPAEIRRAVERGDTEAALEMAALNGSADIVRQTQRSVADGLLAQAERWRKHGSWNRARAQIRTVRDELGDPRPHATNTVDARIDRDERAAARRAAERKSRAARALQVAKPPQPQSTSGSPTSRPKAPAASTPPATSSPKVEPKQSPETGRDPGWM